jgi:hypothetical protein
MKRDITFSGPRKWHNPEAARLRLACLKENFEYRDFWDEHKPEVLEFFQGGRWTVGTSWGFLPGLERFDIHYPAVVLLPAEDSLSLLDPYIEQVTEKASSVVPRLFRTLAPGITQITREGAPQEADAVSLALTFNRPIEPEPHERLLMVDLTKPRAQLVAEFKALLDKAGTDASRHREEAFQQLEVWRMVGRGQKFRQIAQALGITEDAAKHAHWRAYERTQGRKYDPEKYRRAAIHKKSLLLTCGDCPSRVTCTLESMKKTCPAVLRYIDQDEVKRRERLSNDDFTDGPEESLL